jgi:hypothetical protein
LEREIERFDSVYLNIDQSIKFIDVRAVIRQPNLNSLTIVVLEFVLDHEFARLKKSARGKVRLVRGSPEGAEWIVTPAPVPSGACDAPCSYR